jgi:hypothetical protein
MNFDFNWSINIATVKNIFAFMNFNNFTDL